MSKKYLVNETEKWAAEKLTGRPMDAKEVEVLDDVYVCELHYNYTAKSNLNHFYQYLQEHKYLIVKIIE